MNIALLGARGQVGSEVALLARAQGQMINTFDRNNFDITDSKKLHRTLLDLRPDVVINCAAYTAVDKAESEPEQAFRVNRDASATMAQACAELKCPLLHLSTDYVFAGQADKPYQEKDTTAPLGIYGQSKWEGEEKIRAIHPQHIIVRTSWVFGAYGNNFVKTILRLASEREQLKIVADQSGGPTPARAIAAMLLRITQAVLGGQQAWGTYHFSGQPAVTWYDFAKAIVEYAQPFMKLIVNDIKPITTAEYPTPAQRPHYSVLNTDKIKQVFAISSPDWHSAVKQMIEEITHATIST